MRPTSQAGKKRGQAPFFARLVSRSAIGLDAQTRRGGGAGAAVPTSGVSLFSAVLADTRRGSLAP